MDFVCLTEGASELDSIQATTTNHEVGYGTTFTLCHPEWLSILQSGLVAMHGLVECIQQEQQLLPNFTWNVSGFNVVVGLVDH